MTQRRVVVTGLGCVAASGLGVDRLWQAVESGTSAVRSVTMPRTQRQRIGHAAYFEDFEVAEHFPPERARLIDRFSAFAMLAADEAMQQAGFAPGRQLDHRAAVIIGSGIGGASTVDQGCYDFYVRQSRPDPMGVPKMMPNAAASLVSMRTGAAGPCFCISSACASATQAIGIGAQLVRAGAVDIALVGGSEALITPAGFHAWEALRVMTPTLCRPFSAGRDGMVLGEGAGLLVVESLDSARSRGAEILAEIVGYGTSSDAGDLLRPDPDGAARAIAMALSDGGLDPSEVDYINAHGTGTYANDIAETTALQAVFGDSLPGIAVSSTKPIHGHALGAGGAIELIVAVKALAAQVAPPTINFLGPDPACVLDVVPGVARRRRIDVALSNSLAFGGINATLALRRFG